MSSDSADAKSREVSLWAMRRLPNGVFVQLITGGQPAMASIAVCSSDGQGTPGPLNMYVLGAAGFPLSELPKWFKPPATLITVSKPPVLVVHTVGSKPARDLLPESLRVGLGQLERSPPNESMFLPLLGTGAAMLSPPESADLMLSVLAERTSPTVRRVFLAAPDATVASGIAHRWEDNPTELSLSLDRAESHVRTAINVAAYLAGPDLVGPRQVLEAIASVQPHKSAAFGAITRMVRLPSNTIVPNWLGNGISEMTVFDPSAELRAQLQYAQDAAKHADRSFWGRDLVTAALLAGGRDLEDLFSSAGSELSQVRDKWYEFVTENEPVRTREEWDNWWAFAHVPPPGEATLPRNDQKPPAPEKASPALPGAYQAGFLADSSAGVDCLGVEEEARAFARLILDEGVDPPMSIGLLGDWGSGKSFFIRELKKQIDSCKGSPGLHRDVVCVDFNAWHVSDGNLWASLVTHIFEKIWQAAVPKGEQEGSEARKQLIEQISKAQGAVHEAGAEVARAQEAVNKASDKRDEQLRLLALTNVLKDTDALKQLADAAKRAGWEGPVENLVELQTTAKAIADSGQRLRMQLAGAFNRLPTFVAVATVVGAGLWLLLEQPLLHGLGDTLRHGLKVVTTIGSMAAGLGVPLGLAKRRLDQFGKALADARKTAEATQSPEVEAARKDLKVTEASLQTARARLAELSNQAVALDPARRLGAFLEERIQSTQYRSQQGIISLVHRDFELLSNLMEAWRRQRRGLAPTEQLKDVPPSKTKPIDRIVLFIDDLDRCRPEHVVSALEAVHLLLALDLFVVVVAVDSRWLIRALEVQYKEMLTQSGEPATAGARSRSTAHDYLEKIFQLTYALAPMAPAKFGAYVEALTKPHRWEQGVTLEVSSPRHLPSDNALASEVKAAPSKTTTNGTAMSSSAPTGSLRPPEAASFGHSSAGKTGSDPADATGSTAHQALPPLELGPHEKQVFTGLVLLLPTPRIAKRVANVYRVIKTSFPSLVATPPEQKAALFLLATLFGRPNVGGVLLQALFEHTHPFDHGEVSLSEAIASYTASRRNDTPEATEWKAFARLAETLAADLTVDNCRRAPGVIARYSFVTGHEWHTWVAPKEKEAVESPGKPTAPKMKPAHKGDDAPLPV